MSKNFQGRTGKAYLFNTAFNMDLGPPKDKQMMTGLHTVRAIICKGCRETVGWTYVVAFEQREKYKEGKFIIEKSFMVKYLSPEIEPEDLQEEDCNYLNSGEGLDVKEDHLMEANHQLADRTTV